MYYVETPSTQSAIIPDAFSADFRRGFVFRDNLICLVASESRFSSIRNSSTLPLVPLKQVYEGIPSTAASLVMLPPAPTTASNAEISSMPLNNLFRECTSESMLPLLCLGKQYNSISVLFFRSFSVSLNS